MAIKKLSTREALLRDLRADLTLIARTILRDEDSYVERTWDEEIKSRIHGLAEGIREHKAYHISAPEVD